MDEVPVAMVTTSVKTTPTQRSTLFESQPTKVQPRCHVQENVETANEKLTIEIPAQRVPW